MLSRKATAVLLAVHAAAMLASQTEAFVPIFTYGEVQRMQVRYSQAARLPSVAKVTHKPAQRQASLQ